MKTEKDPQPFGDALEEHSAEGIDILMGTSSILSRGIVYILIGLILIFFIWSVFGKADVVVSAHGLIEPDPEIRRVYAPTDGELTKLYVAEGMPVSKDDLLARIKAPNAIKFATAAVQAKIRFDEAKREKSLFPQRKLIMEKELESIKKQIDSKEKEYAQLTKEGLRRLSEKQKNRLAVLRNSLDEAKRVMNSENALYAKYKRLIKTTGGGGISKNQIENQKNKYLNAAGNFSRLENELGNLVIDFSKQYTETNQRIDNTYIALLRLRLKYENKKQENENAETKSDMNYLDARTEWEAASKISFEDLDQENLLRITAPISGEIMHVAYTQAGEKVSASKPLVSIAPTKAKKIVTINIFDRDRGLIKVGQPVKLKFAAFPYQRYGTIRGTLEYISPGAEPSMDGKPLYRSRVSIEKDYFTMNGENIQLNFGMTVTAEIVVQKRRIIDFALDPFRKIKG